jgi:Zn-dependent peptidase ImmA (M78 family)
LDYEAPFLPYDRIREIAREFLEKHNPENTLPVDIEVIVEHDMKIEIIPLLGLRQGYFTEAYLSKDLRTIYIDDIYFNQMNLHFRYRYTLAHETGHLILHRDFYKEANYANIEEWKQLIQSIPKDQYSWFERHAYDFAGLVLVPDATLETHFKEAIEKLTDKNVENFDKATLLEWISKWIGQTYYKVSAQVIKKRLEYDGLHL